jgi:hypothetical protein
MTKGTSLRWFFLMWRKILKKFNKEALKPMQKWFAEISKGWRKLQSNHVDFSGDKWWKIFCLNTVHVVVWEVWFIFLTLDTLFDFRH